MDDSEKLEELYRKINDADSRGMLTEMADYMREALELTKRLYDEDGSEVIEMLTDLGGLLKYIGAYQESEEDLNEALRLIAKREGRESINYATGMLNLAGLYRFLKRYQMAESLMLSA